MSHFFVKVTLDAALTGIEVPEPIKRELTVVYVTYRSFDHRHHQGYLIVHKDLAASVTAIFREIEEAHFPIDRVVPMSSYRWSDDASMAHNNTSAFNYRPVPGTDRLSQHSYGRAIDINPRLNPYERAAGVMPPGAHYDPTVPGTIRADGPVVYAFEKRGWEWGGRWDREKDWQHFSRRASR